MLFSILLLIHFLAFVTYLIHLALLWPTKGAAPRGKAGLILGVILLLTGALLVWISYPHINYYKVVPKTLAFLVVTLINIRFGERDLSKAAYFGLFALTISAGCIAIFH